MSSQLVVGCCGMTVGNIGMEFLQKTENEGFRALIQGCSLTKKRGSPCVAGRGWRWRGTLAWLHWAPKERCQGCCGKHTALVRVFLRERVPPIHGGSSKCSPKHAAVVLELELRERVPHSYYGGSSIKSTIPPREGHAHPARGPREAWPRCAGTFRACASGALKNEREDDSAPQQCLVCCYLEVHQLPP